MLLALNGPVGVGKTPVSKMVAQRLECQRIDLDELRFLGVHAEFEDDRLAQLHCYNEDTICRLRELTSKGSMAIVDCGGLDLYIRDEQQKAKVENIKKSGAHVFALLPFSDLKQTREWLASDGKLNLLVDDVSMFEDIADETFYVNDRDLKEVADEILRWICNHETQR